MLAKLPCRLVLALTSLITKANVLASATAFGQPNWNKKSLKANVPSSPRYGDSRGDSFSQFLSARSLLALALPQNREIAKSEKRAYAFLRACAPRVWRTKKVRDIRSSKTAIRLSPQKNPTYSLLSDSRKHLKTDTRLPRLLERSLVDRAKFGDQRKPHFFEGYPRTLNGLFSVVLTPMLAVTASSERACRDLQDKHQSQHYSANIRPLNVSSFL